MWKFLKRLFGKNKNTEKTELKKEREWTLEEVNIIKNEIKSLNEKISKEVEESRQKSIASAEEKNSCCPKCKSRNVNDRIRRTQGDLKSSTSSYGLFSSASVSAKIDTNEVNKCNKCDHEWKKAEPYLHGSYGMLEFWADRVRYMLKSYSEYKNCTFDPLDVNESFSSIEEKEESLKKTYESNLKRVSEFWSGINIITLKELMRRDEYDLNYFNEHYDEGVLILAGFVK